MTVEQRIAEWIATTKDYRNAIADLGHEIGDDGHDYGITQKHFRRFSDAVYGDCWAAMPKMPGPFDAWLERQLEEVDWDDIAEILITRYIDDLPVLDSPKEA